MSFGERLKELRNEKKMTQSDVGKIINVSKASVSLYEKNERTPDQDSIKKLASYFNVSTDFCLGLLMFAQSRSKLTYQIQKMTPS